MHWPRFAGVGLGIIAFASVASAQLPPGSLLTINPTVFDPYGAHTIAAGSFWRNGVLMTGGTDGGILIGQAQQPGAFDTPSNFAGQTIALWSRGDGLDTDDFSNLRLSWGHYPEMVLAPATVFKPDLPFWEGDPTAVDFDLNGSVTGLEFRENGDGTYDLNYGFEIVSGNPSFIGAIYQLHLEGQIIPVPEPASLGLVAGGIVALAALRRSIGRPRV